MEIIGVILAGGRSRRMSEDKALLKINGISLLQRQFQLLENLLGKGNVFVSGDRSEFPHIVDLETDIGPLGGLISVCRYFFHQNRSQWLLVVPVDMPFLTEQGLSRLIQRSGRGAIGKFKGQQLPFIVRDIDTVLEAANRLRGDCAVSDVKHQGSLGKLFLGVDVDEISAESEMFFTNINTPEDWHAAIS